MSKDDLTKNSGATQFERLQASARDFTGLDGARLLIYEAKVLRSAQAAYERKAFRSR